MISNVVYNCKSPINLAKKAYKLKEIPVGALIIKENKIISKAYNTREHSQQAINHAEIIAIKKACKKLKTNKLVGCDIYVTKEPCLMCMGAIINSRIENLFFGCYDTRFNVVKNLDNFKFNHTVNIVGVIMEKECALSLSKFFKKLRG